MRARRDTTTRRDTDDVTRHGADVTPTRGAAPRGPIHRCRGPRPDRRPSTDGDAERSLPGMARSTNARTGRPLATRTGDPPAAARGRVGLDGDDRAAPRERPLDRTSARASSTCGHTRRRGTPRRPSCCWPPDRARGCPTAPPPTSTASSTSPGPRRRRAGAARCTHTRRAMSGSTRPGHRVRRDHRRTTDCGAPRRPGRYLDLAAGATVAELERLALDLARRDRDGAPPGRRAARPVPQRSGASAPADGHLAVARRCIAPRLAARGARRPGAAPARCPAAAVAVRASVISEAWSIKRVDAAWPDRRALAEFDGRAYHDDGGTRGRRPRDARARCARSGGGCEVFRRADLGGERMHEFAAALRG